MHARLFTSFRACAEDELVSPSLLALKYRLQDFHSQAASLSIEISPQNRPSKASFT